MRLVCVSDTHSMHRQMKHPIPDGDVFIHAGDSLGLAKLRELEDFNEWLGELPHKHKIVIAGNHDWCLANSNVPLRVLTNAVYLQDSAVEISGVKFWGSPWTPAYTGR